MTPPTSRLRRTLVALLVATTLAAGATRTTHAQIFAPIVDPLTFCNLENPVGGNPLCPIPIAFTIFASVVSKVLLPAVLDPVIGPVFGSPLEALQAFQQSGFIRPHFRSVDSTEAGWQDTGIDIPSGAFVIFKPSGEVQYKYDSYDFWGNPTGNPVYIGPAGGDVTVGHLAPLAMPNSMVFKVGGSGLPLSVITPVLQTAAYPIPFGGRLYLGMNDCDGCYHDNAGSWQVEVHVTSVTPAAFARPPATLWSSDAVVVPIAGLTPIAVDASPVTSIEYELNGAPGALPVVSSDVDPAAPSPALTVAGDGFHTLWYRAVSADGSTSAWQVMQFGIDTAPPSVAVHMSPAPGASGWHTGPVSVSFTCADAGSGVASCPSGFTAYSSVAGTAIAVDHRGNVGTVSYSVNIDGDAPVTGIEPASALSDWLTADTVLTLQASDAGSGVHQTFWRVNGGSAQSGAQVAITAEGTSTVEFWSVDHAGNVESVRSATVRLDRTAPAITGSLDRPANDHGWYDSPVSATFQCSDDGSGVAACAAPVVFDAEGAGQAGTGTARDHAGNEAAATVSGVHVDLTPPTITGATDRPANDAGWYNAPVTVSFTCSDALSGVVSCSGPSTLGTSGDGQQRDGVARDAAGHEATAAVTGLNIDLAPPATMAALSSPANANGWHAGPVQVALTAQDQHSGVARTEYQLDGGAWLPYTSPVSLTGDGVHALGYRSIDHAGHVEATNTVVVRIDTTAPEAFLRFNPVTRDIDVFGTDAGGLLSPSPMPPVAVAAARGVAVRKYLLTDRAGNTLALALEVAKPGQNVRAAIQSLAYNGQPAGTPAHSIHFTWTTDRTGLTRNVQSTLEVGPGGSGGSIDASYIAQQDRTVLTENGVTTHVPGLVLVRVTTDAGALALAPR